MNNKQLLFVFLSIFACNSTSLIANKMDKQEALSFLPQHVAAICDYRFSDECSFAAEHIKKASQLREKKADTEDPDHDKKYWSTLSREEQKAIAAATTTILNSPEARLVALQEVFKALQ